MACGFRVARFVFCFEIFWVYGFVVFGLVSQGGVGCVFGGGFSNGLFVLGCRHFLLRYWIL